TFGGQDTVVVVMPVAFILPMTLRHQLRAVASSVSQRRFVTPCTSAHRALDVLDIGPWLNRAQLPRSSVSSSQQTRASRTQSQSDLAVVDGDSACSTAPSHNAETPRGGAGSHLLADPVG